MAYKAASWPAQVWDGNTPDNSERPNRQCERAPNGEDWDQIVAELIAVQQTLSGGVAKTPSANVTAATTTHALNSTFSDTEVEGALNTLATKINSILTCLKDKGLMASS